MSGGHWSYEDGRLASEIFGWNMDAHYGERGWQQSQTARNLNPLEDREISEMVWDVMCLLNSFDYYKSGDNSIETYSKDLDHFKKKWFKRTTKDRLQSYKNDLKDYYEKLLEEFADDGSGTDQ